MCNQRPSPTSDAGVAGPADLSQVWPKLWRHEKWTRERVERNWEDVIPGEDCTREDVLTHGQRDSSELALPSCHGLDAESLSTEIGLLILRLLPLTCLTRVTILLSRRFHYLSTAILYREIDASLHHYKIPDTNSEADFSWAHWDCDRVLERQHHLLNLLTTKPNYASNVSSLIWTVGITRTKQLETVGYVDTHLNLFAVLENITRVDIDTGFASVIPTHQDWRFLYFLRLSPYGWVA